MSLSITLAQYNNGVSGYLGQDKVTLKAENVSPQSITRKPIIIPLPSGSIVGIDLGYHYSEFSVSGVADLSLKELYVSDASSFDVTSEFVISGSSTALNDLTYPKRAAVPTATVIAKRDNVLIVKNVSGFFVDGETIEGAEENGSATVVAPLATKSRLEQISRFWHSAGRLKLTLLDGTYEVYISGMQFNLIAGYEDRFTFRINFAEAQQGITGSNP